MRDSTILVRSRRLLSWIAAGVAIVSVTGGLHYRLNPVRFLTLQARAAAQPVLAWWLQSDEVLAAESRGKYLISASNASSSTLERESAFVFESPDAPHLVRLRREERLDDLIADASSEYDAMLQLGRWAGERFDHGDDPIPGGPKLFDPVAVVELGKAGSKFNCHVAARLVAYAATSLGWPARVTTASRDGYNWEHAVAELWSDQLEKWFAVDADFNEVYEAGGVPLSAFELCHRGPELRRAGRLQTNFIAPRKLGVTRQDMLPFYEYVHIDLRNDWYTRRLSAGSPAGGDLATWWTARPTLGPLLTAKIRVDDQSRFDWAINRVAVRVLQTEAVGNDDYRVKLELSAYSPYFRNFEVSVDDGPWKAVTERVPVLALRSGSHRIGSRVRTRSMFPGRATRLEIVI